MGDVISSINYAKKELSKLSFNKRIRSSSLYRTKAWGKTDQPDFFNQLFIFKSLLPPIYILNRLLDIERKRGRVRIEKWGARNLDLDILYCGNTVLKKTELILPHPELQNRRFCLIPLNEMLPDFIHPTLKLSNKRLLELCNDKGFVEKY